MVIDAAALCFHVHEWFSTSAADDIWSTQCGLLLLACKNCSSRSSYIEHLKWNEHFQGSTVEQSLEKKIHTRWSFFCRLFCNFDSIRCVAITVLFLKAKVEKKITQCNNVLVIRGKFVKKILWLWPRVCCELIEFQTWSKVYIMVSTARSSI